MKQMPENTMVPTQYQQLTLSHFVLEKFIGHVYSITPGDCLIKSLGLVFMYPDHHNHRGHISAEPTTAPVKSPAP